MAMPMKTLELHHPMLQFFIKWSSPPSKSMEFIGITSSYSDFVLLSYARDKTNNTVFHIQLFRDRDLAHFSSSPFQISSHFVTRFTIATKKCKSM